MSPKRIASITSPAAIAAHRSFHVFLGTRLSEVCRERSWTIGRLADAAGVSRSHTYEALEGEPVSTETVMRLVTALGLKLEWELVDPKRKGQRPRQDLVHSAMAEFEASHFRPFKFGLAIDAPYQHYQFAGRADLVAWDTNTLALLHIENRTRFPDLQEVAGSFNAKIAYLGSALAQRVGIRGWRSETHVIAALWSAEVLHSLRLRTETFRTLCPDEPAGFASWWAGTPPPQGRFATFVLLDPLATRRQRPVLGLDDALGARPRHAGYAEAATKLTGRSTNAA